MRRFILWGMGLVVWLPSLLLADTLTLSIHEIQGQADASPYEGDTVRTYGIITAVYNNYGYTIQERAGGPWSGILVYTSGTSFIDTLQAGDSVEVVGVVKEYYSMTEVYARGVGYLQKIAPVSPLPPETLATDSVNLEKWEGVYVLVDSAVCTDPNLGYGEWEIDDGTGPCRVDDIGVAYTPEAGAMYQVIGPVFYTYGNYKLEPQDSAHIVFLGYPQDPPPYIGDVSHAPVQPTPDDVVLVQATITDNSAVVDDSLFYAIGLGYIAVPHDSVVGDMYYYHIPPQADGTTVQYFIWAMDDSGQVTVSDTFNYTVVAPVSGVKINEVFYDAATGQGAEPHAEWIELYNSSESDIDLSGWMIADDPDPNGTSEGRFTFPTGTVLPAGGFLVLAYNADTFAAYWDATGITVIAYGDSAQYLSLANSGDDVHLFDASLAEVDAMWYGSGGDMGSTGAAPDVSAGHSLARYPDGQDTNDPSADFQDSPVPTPGRPNQVGALCGDANNDGVVDAADLDLLARYLWLGGADPGPQMDVNGDGTVNSEDVVYLSAYLFHGGPAPNCP